jgi:tryptophan halogenase
VALGLSSGFLEPLESTSIYLIQIAIMHLLPLLPTRRHDQRLVDEFNLRMDIEYERIRDFLILHYHLNSRGDAELWRYCRSMEVPESLERKMRLFRHSGVVEQYKDGLFTPPSWLAVYLGQGLTPMHYNPLADAIPVDRLLDQLGELRTDIRDRVDEMPKHASLLARYANAQPVSDALLHEAEARL